MRLAQWFWLVCLRAWGMRARVRVPTAGPRSSPRTRAQAAHPPLPLSPRSNKQSQQSRSAIEATAAAAAAAVRGAHAGENPYSQWWSLRFEPQPAADATGCKPGWSYRSSVDYAPVLLQVWFCTAWSFAELN